MVEAWQKRGWERQQLLEGLMRETYDREEELGDPIFLFRLAKTILAHIQQRHWNAPRHDLNQMEDFFHEAVFPAIHELARSQAEEDALMAEFFEKLIKAVLQPFHSALLREENETPEHIFRAPSAMAEVPLEG